MARTWSTDLCEATRRRARLGVLANGRVAYIEKRVGADPVTPFGVRPPCPRTPRRWARRCWPSRRGRRWPRWLPSLTAYTPHTLHTAERLHRALGIVRLTRSAVAHGELVLGESAVAVPVFGCGGEVVAALEVELHDVRADLELCRAALAVAARGLSRELAVDHDRVDRPRLRLLPAAGRRTAPCRSDRRRPSPRSERLPRGPQEP